MIFIGDKRHVLPPISFVANIPEDRGKHHPRQKPKPLETGPKGITALVKIGE
jgi:hypothetical protein